MSIEADVLLFLLLVAGRSFPVKSCMRSSVDILREDVEKDIKTFKNDIKTLRVAAEEDVDTLRGDFRKVIKTFRQDVTKDVQSLRNDVNTMSKDAKILERKLSLLVIQHENFVLATGTQVNKSMESKMPPDYNNRLQTFNHKIDELMKKQNHLEQHTLKKTVDNLEKKVDDKIYKVRKLMKEIGEKCNKQYDVIKSLQKMDNVVQEELNSLTAIVNSDLKTRVGDFERHITTIRNAKDEADKILSNLQNVVEQIRPNTFNKDNAMMAFMVVVLLVLCLSFWMYRVQQSVTEMKKFQ